MCATDVSGIYEGCPSSKVVMGWRRLSPPAWVAAPSFGSSVALLHGILLGAWSRLLLGRQGEERETRDE